MIRRLSILAMLLAILASSCSDETVMRPERKGLGGTVSGRVFDADGPLLKWVRVESVARDHGIDSSWPEALVYAKTDSAGRYTIAVPPGEYRVGVHTGGSSDFSFDDRADLYWRKDALASNWRYGDTLRVDVGTERDSIDFSLGSLSLDLSVSEAWVGAGLRVRALRDPSASHADDTWMRTFLVESASPDLSIDFGDVPPGRYRFEIDFTEGQFPSEIDLHSIWLPHSLTQEGADVTVVEAGAHATYAAEFAPDILHVDGVIDGAWRELGGSLPSVVIFTAELAQVELAVCDSTGAFAFTIPARVPFRLGLSSGSVGFGVAWIGGATPEQSTIYEPPPEGPMQGLRFTDSAIEVLPIGSTQPSGLINIALFDEFGRIVRERRIQSPGVRLAIPFLNPGTYRLLTSPGLPFYESWLPQYFDHANDLENATPIAIAAGGQLLTVEMSLQRGGSISGNVTIGGAELVQDADVYLADANEPKILGLARFNRGHYIAAGIPPGRYRVGVIDTRGGRLPRHALEIADIDRWYPGVDRWEDGTPVTIAGTDSIAGIDISLP